MPIWGTAADWDAAQSEDGVVHESVANTSHDDDTIVKQGYRIAAPFLASNLYRFYPLHEASGSTAYDFSGNGQDGTYSGTTPGGTGLLGTNAPVFDGSGDVVDIPRTPLLDGTNDFTIAAWFNQDVIAEHTIFSEYNTDGRITFGPGYSTGDINYSDDQLVMQMNRDVWAGVASSTRLSTDTFYHGAVSYSASNGMTLYLNANQEDTDGNTGQLDTHSADIYIGGEGRDSRYFNGRIAGVWIYDKVLSASEVQTHYDVVRTPGTLTTGVKTL